MVMLPLAAWYVTVLAFAALGNVSAASMLIASIPAGLVLLTLYFSARRSEPTPTRRRDKFFLYSIIAACLGAILWSASHVLATGA